MRLMLENLMWTESTFVTLTYEDEMLPLCKGGMIIDRGLTKNSSVEVLPTLMVEDLRNWLKRIRKAIAPARLRYYAVGEYGGKGGRPHYHIAVFGYRGCDYEDSRLSPNELCRCVSCVLLRATWRLGFVHQGTIELKSMQYLMGYVLKGMRRRDDERLRGRDPEFARMSLRPGIGAAAMHDVAKSLKQYGLAEDGSAPPALRIGNRILPVGRYLRKKLREELGGSGEATEREVAEAKERMRPMYEIAKAFTDQSLAYGSAVVSDKLLYRVIVEANREKARQLEAREKLFRKG